MKESNREGLPLAIWLSVLKVAMGARTKEYDGYFDMTREEMRAFMESAQRAKAAAAGIELPQQPEIRNSWANITGSKLRKSERKNKNVLEISLELERNNEDFSSDVIEELFKQLRLKCLMLRPFSLILLIDPGDFSSS